MIKKAFFYIVICAIIAGTNGILVKYMFTMSIGIIAWFRAAVPVIVVLPNIYKSKKFLLTNNYRKMLFISFLCALRMYMYLFAFKYTSIGNAVIIIYSWPIFVCIISVIFTGAKVNLKQIIILGLAFGGLILVYVDKNIGITNYDFIGVILALISAIVYAIIVFMFNTEKKNYDENQLVFYQNIISAIFFIPFLIDLPKVHIGHLGLAIVNGFLIGIVVFKLFFGGLKHLHPITVSSIMYLEVVSSILLGYFIFNEHLGWHTLLGGSLIILSGFLLSFVKSSQI